jgi:phospholipase C
MSILNDFSNVRLVDNQSLHFYDSKSENSRIVQPGDFLEVAGEVAGGQVIFRAASYDKDKPTVTSGRPDNPRTDYNCVPADVEIYKGEERVETHTTPSGTQGMQKMQVKREINAGPMLTEKPDSRIRWRLRMTNTSAQPILGNVTMEFIRDSVSIGSQAVPLRVLNHAFGVVLDALKPYVAVIGNTLTVALGSEVQELIKEYAPEAKLSYTKELPFDWKGQLLTVGAEVISGAKLLTAVRDAKNRSAEWRAAWKEKVTSDMVVVYLELAFSEIVATQDVIFTDIDVLTIEPHTMQIYLAFEKYVGPSRPSSCHILCFSPVEMAGKLLTIFSAVVEQLDKLVQPVSDMIHRYFAMVLARMSRFHGELATIFVDMRIQDKNVIVRWAIDPDVVRATRPQATRTGRVPRGRILVHDRAPGSDDLDIAASDDSIDFGQPGEIPPGFEMGDPITVSRLDAIDTIVVIMMENRSYDHMLGYLHSQNSKYDGFTAQHHNKYVDASGAEHTVRMRPIKDLIRTGNDYMAIPDDPFHGYDHVQKQINNGEMDGFAADLLTRPGNPEFALSYYDGQQLPIYHDLANTYKVCTRWFCAHPGGTYPNRWATIHGTLPDLRNIHLDDPRMGFITNTTIFDVLTNRRIDWNYFENNVSMIRMYARFRLDDKNVLPYLDENEGFAAKAAAGTLPPVVFIEPRITGVPPLEQASDDHPPANLSNGQDFIEDVVAKLKRSPQWDKSLLVITYDEHGGFYDHVPPPGTAKGPSAWLNKVPEIFPSGPTYMGPRVPTFIVSPHVTAGSVSDSIFDHTTIIKSILVRHRSKLFQHQLNMFGDRVRMINHLGYALDGLTVRDVAPQPRMDRQYKVVGPAVFPPAFNPRQPKPGAQTVGQEMDAFDASLARAMLPKKGIDYKRATH